MRDFTVVDAVDGLVERERLEEVWGRERSHTLPVDAHGIWCTNEAATPLPRQGWKLHVSATVLTATETLTRVAPVLERWGVHFKAPRTLADLAELNCGLFSAYTQVGKFITAYPVCDPVALAVELDAATADLPGPAVPSEPALRPGSRVSYRYGVYRPEPGEPEGAVRQLRTPDGRMVPDVRDLDHATPDWVNNPFPAPAARSQDGPSTHPYLGYAALRQRGKGGTYRAMDVSQDKTRPCILKEGRRHGETDWYGVDGFHRMRREAEVLHRLHAVGVPVPQVYGTVELPDHFYLAMQEVDGVDLQRQILHEPTPSLQERLRICRTVAGLVADIHRSGLAWRDCKPGNIILANPDAGYALDFEGACDDQDQTASGFGTRHYLPGNWMTVGSGWQSKDCYALGITLAQVLGWSLDLISGHRKQTVSSGERIAHRLSHAQIADEYRQVMGEAGIPERVTDAVLALLEGRGTDRPTAQDTLSMIDDELQARHA